MSIYEISRACTFVWILSLSIAQLYLFNVQKKARIQRAFSFGGSIYCAVSDAASGVASDAASGTVLSVLPPAAGAILDNSSSDIVPVA